MLELTFQTTVMDSTLLDLLVRSSPGPVRSLCFGLSLGVFFDLFVDRSFKVSSFNVGLTLSAALLNRTAGEQISVVLTLFRGIGGFPLRCLPSVERYTCSKLANRCRAAHYTGSS